MTFLQYDVCSSNGRSRRNSTWFCNRSLSPPPQMLNEEDENVQDSTISTSDKSNSQLQEENNWHRHPKVCLDHKEFGILEEISHQHSHNAIEVYTANENGQDNPLNEETESESEVDDEDRDQNFNIDNYLYDREKLLDVDVSNSEEYDSDQIQVENEGLNYFDENPEENTANERVSENQKLNDSLAEKLKREKIRKQKLIKLNKRKEALAVLRKETNFDLYLRGEVCPNRRKPFNNPDTDIVYYPCVYCKGIFRKNYLRRHIKNCSAEKDNKSSQNCVAKSQTFTACHMDPANVVSKLSIKETVFDMMRGDEVSFEVKKDLLIVHFGDSYLKKHRKERSTYTCSNRMRELSRLLITFRKLTNNELIDFKTLLHPKHFEAIITSARNLSGYDHSKKTFRSPSLAMHLGTSLKIISDELIHLILKEARGFTCKNRTESQIWLDNVKNFKKLVESREETFKIVENCEKAFKNNTASEKDYKTLVQCLLALLIIFNRRRIGDVQYLKISDYKNDQRSNYTDFENVLSSTEKVLATKYRRVLNSGKGSRAVVILFPEVIEIYIKLLLEHRNKFIEEDNDYLFAIPGSKVKWGRGDIAIRNLTKKMRLKNPSAITSNKLRKQIATVMQILNLSKDDVKQFSTFMGHTEKTHEEFYELPVDLYQTAKVSKMLLMIEKGVPVEHKGKSLSEIDINIEYAEENNDLQINNDVSVEESVNIENGDQEENVFLNEPSTSNAQNEEKENDENDHFKISNKKRTREKLKAEGT
ncbi:hypothetical protein NQ314_017595 [Rhamnusium bicolor]|uniref:Uncharacterized protein n=1 Tax=Rhamnusium bicolor TaxID=1586634 RepID=A0AAV8WTC1_9CUCU|nr:hypothetical protein NQ314_017595 [Rhamnusium bicolor]